MTEENIKKLADRYPEILVDSTGIVSCELSVGDGWYNIIDLSCHLMQKHIEWNRKYNNWDESITVKAIQIKEKFGGLRFYIYGGDEYCRGVVGMAESLSYRTCEVCGNEGKERDDGWIRTLCDAHEQERQWRRNDKSKTVLPDS